MIRLYAHIRIIVVLTGGKLTWIYFLYYFLQFTFVTTHLCQGNKVSILLPDDVNSEPVASRRCLLETVPIMR
jgi:hypothetical protein